MDEAAILEEMRLAVTADKVAGEPAGWSPGSRPEQLLCVLPLDVMVPTKATAALFLRAVRNTPDRDVSATLRVTLQGRDFHAWRFDWRPPHDHVNVIGPRDLKGLIVRTGIHDFAVNAALGLERMHTGNLPVCVPVHPEPHDFDAFVRCACDRLRITLTERVLSPPWSPTLL